MNAGKRNGINPFIFFSEGPKDKKRKKKSFSFAKYHRTMRFTAKNMHVGILKRELHMQNLISRNFYFINFSSISYCFLVNASAFPGAIRRKNVRFEGSQNRSKRAI